MVGLFEESREADSNSLSFSLLSSVKKQKQVEDKIEAKNPWIDFRPSHRTLRESRDWARSNDGFCLVNEKTQAWSDSLIRSRREFWEHALPYHTYQPDA